VNFTGTLIDFTKFDVVPRWSCQEQRLPQKLMNIFWNLERISSKNMNFVNYDESVKTVRVREIERTCNGNAGIRKALRRR